MKKIHHLTVPGQTQLRNNNIILSLSKQRLCYQGWNQKEVFGPLPSLKTKNYLAKSQNFRTFLQMQEQSVRIFIIQKQLLLCVVLWIQRAQRDWWSPTTLQRCNMIWAIFHSTALWMPRLLGKQRFFQLTLAPPTLVTSHFHKNLVRSCCIGLVNNSGWNEVIWPICFDG